MKYTYLTHKKVHMSNNSIREYKRERKRMVLESIIKNEKKSVVSIFLHVFVGIIID